MFRRVNTTACPADPTFCPETPTECPQDPTVCVVTACPVESTFCPIIPTECPVPTTTTTTPPWPDFIDFDPNPFNINSPGDWATVHIELPDRSDPAEIDPATILLNFAVSPVLDPTYDFVTDEDLYLVDETCEPGVMERMVKFDGGAVAEILPVGEEVPIVIMYQLYDGTPFMGIDEIRVIDF